MMLLPKQTEATPEQHELGLFVFTCEDVEQYWDELEPFILRSIAVSYGTMKIEDVHEMLLKGHANAFAAVKNNTFTAVMVLRPIFYARYTALRIIALSGKNLKAAIDWMPIIANFGQQVEAIEFEAWCRPSMVRLLRRWGWEPRLTQMSLSIKRTLQ